MSDALAGALIALGGALVVGFIANFVSEDYRRFRDSKALARALAGELSSRGDAVDLLQKSLTQILSSLNGNEKVRLLKIEKVTDYVFESSIAKLGLLESDLVEDVVYVYENIGAFRSALGLAAEADAGDPQAALLVEAARSALGRASKRGGDLPNRLRAYANRPYRLFSERRK